MGQAKLRGTPQERRELAIAWDEAHREDAIRYPKPTRTIPRGNNWVAAVAAALALTASHRH